MGSFVLVSGAWLGGWAWERVAARLEDAGHRVVAPSLTGLGDRAGQGGPWVGLETHVTDVLMAIEAAGPGPLTLVAHSYGGFPAAAAADRVPSRIGRLVLLETGVPVDGESVFDAAGPQFRAIVEAHARERGDGWRWPMPEPEILDLFLPTPDMDPLDRARLRAGAEPHPVRTMSEPVRLSGAIERIPTTYVACVLPGSEAASSALGVPPDWEVRTIRSSHWPMISRPDGLTEILLEAAAESPARVPVAAGQSIATTR